MSQEISKRLDNLEKELKALNLGQTQDLETARASVLSKKGALSELMKSMGGLSPDQRPKAGALINEFRSKWTQLILDAEKGAKEAALLNQLKSEKIDVSLSGRQRNKVAPHPVQEVQDEFVRIFESCGFVVELGPELEHEFYNFDALNFVSDHPARSMQATFFIEGHTNLLMRTHTSPVQIRTMLTQKPPIRMICPGRVYRADYDATHTPMFHQIEGLLIDEKTHLGELKGILEKSVRDFFGTSLKIRLRPSFFPFTEPSAEVDVECCFCSGKGCQTCKHSGWIEIGGCGMVDPEVLKAVNLDTEKYRGFAFGMGLERMTMLKYGINDLRAFFESDERFIKQFTRFGAHRS